MEEIQSLIQTESDGSLSFGNYMLRSKEKFDNYECGGDLYKVKTFSEMTKLERNGMFVYESVPGTEVSHYKVDDNEMSFSVQGVGDAQITVGLAEETEYRVFLDDVSLGTMKTNLGGKLSINVEMKSDRESKVRIVRK